MATSTKWIQIAPGVSVAMTIQGNWFSLDAQTRAALFALVDKFTEMEQGEESATLPMQVRSHLADTTICTAMAMGLTNIGKPLEK